MIEERTIDRISNLCSKHHLDEISHRISTLRAFIRSDIASIESAIDEIVFRETVAHAGAKHLLRSDGKRLRPMCVALASKLGEGFNYRAQQFAVAVELVHSATLLHDDVVDIGNMRRGVPTARVLYGNAASIFAGDWLLVEALRRIRSTGLAEALDRILEVIAKMIEAESLQLDQKGKFSLRQEDYFYIANGKTASLFGWALWAGAYAAGLDSSACLRLESFGHKIGVAFQLMDDVLDFSDQTGKSLGTDLREGKMSYPLLLGTLMDSTLIAQLEHLACTYSESECRSLIVQLHKMGAVDATREQALKLVNEAFQQLECFPESEARTALFTVAMTVVARSR